MRKITIIITLFIMLAVFSINLSAIIVTPSGRHEIGETISFKPSSASFTSAVSVDWSFGDDSTTTTKGTSTVTHIYSDPGIYTVTATGHFTSGGPDIIETVRVVVEPEGETRSITVNPLQPIVGQDATFTAIGFYTPGDIRWDMGDGTILRTKGTRSGSRFGNGFNNRFSSSRFGNRFNNRGLRNSRHLARRNGSLKRLSRPMGTSVVSHTYTKSGTYLVRAYDFEGLAVRPVTLTITVTLPARAITVSPTQPLAGAPATFTAVNFLSSLINWNFGDGTISNSGSAVMSHVYANAGTYTVTARETDSTYPLVRLTVTVTLPNRSITYSPQSPRVDQTINFQAINFLTGSIDWNFGDGTLTTSRSRSAGHRMSPGTTLVSHRYTTAGTYTVSARDSTIQHPPVTVTITILAENRQIIVTPPEVRTNDTVTVTALNFRGNLVLWNFGDGTQRSGGYTETHQYARAGTYTITARDENGESDVPFTAQVTVKGIDDQVNLEIAEIRLDNGKYYRVVPKNSRNLFATLRMKMRGTGIVSGYWIVDGHPFEFFNEVVNQGEVREIHTRRMPGLPAIQAGLHTVTVRLTRPNEVPVTFPVLKYYVLSHENSVETTSPLDGFIAKEDEIPTFSWKEPQGASRYQIAFSDYIFPLLNNSDYVKWVDVGTDLSYTPGPNSWNRIRRNFWSYWKVRAIDTNGNVVAESQVQEIKVVIATAKINIDKVTDIKGNPVILTNNTNIKVLEDDLLVHGSVQYMGDSKFLVLRVYVNDQITDQLLFRDVKKKEIRYFETSIPNRKRESRVRFQVLKTSSPSVIVGIKGLILKK